MTELLGKFIRRVTLMAAAVTAIILALLSVTPMERRSYIYTNTLKKQALMDAPSPRMAVVGGSNVFFGIDSQMLTDSLGYNAINMGSQIDIGLKYFMEDAASVLEDGDVLVVMAEYEHFRDMMFGKPVELASALIYDPHRSLSTLNRQQAINALVGVPMYLRNNIFYWVRYSVLGCPFTEGVYTTLNMDRRGDMIDLPHEPGLRELPAPDRLTKPLSDQYLDSFAEVVKRLRRRVRVVVLPPVVTRSFYEANRRQIDETAQALATRGVGYAASPATAVMADTLAFDFSYHPDCIGKRVNTGRIISDLKRAGVSKK